MIDNSHISFRHMRKEDLDSVLDIDRLSFRLPWPENAYRHDLTNNSNAILWVAEYISEKEESKVVGMVDVWLIQEEAHIATLAVHPDYRGNGIAANLLHKVLFEAYKLGARRAMLEVRESNKAARTLYEELGFATVSRRRSYYRDNNEDALLMNLDNLQDLIEEDYDIRKGSKDFLS